MKSHPWFRTLRRVSCLAVVAFLVALGLISPAIAVDTKNVKLYALLVGLEKYQDPGIPGTPMASAAAQLYDFLIERRDLFSDVKVALLLNEKATKANIVEVLTKELSAAGKDDVVIIFMNAHGGHSPVEPGKFYFSPYDQDLKNPQSRLQVNDKKLFENIKSERLLFATGSCYSGGFLRGLQAKGLPPIDFLGHIQGRFGMSAAKAEEVSWNSGKYGMDLFGFYLIKGLRGAADTSKDGMITVKKLYDYLSREVPRETNGVQHPQLFAAKGNPDDTVIYSVPTYTKPLKIDVKFFYETDGHQTKLLTDDAILKSGQHVGVAFRPDSDCYVHILWWDSSGKVGRLYPNPVLTKGSGHAQGGVTQWLPVADKEERWYVLDDNPGDETIYFLASRERNPKIENLYEQLQILSAQARSSSKGVGVAEKMEREINLMGFADYTVPKNAQSVSHDSKESLFGSFDSTVKVSGADAFLKLRFKHERP